jgi:hypothetical protein
MSHEGVCALEGKYGLIPCVFVSNSSLKEGYMAEGNSSQTREGNVRIKNLMVGMKPHQPVNQKWC